MVQVVVGTGSSTKTFNIYKDLLTFYSDYFRTALKNCWKTGPENTIYLPDEDADIFSTFNYWMYTKRLYHQEPSIKDKSAIIEEVPLLFRHLFDMYIFADRRGIPELANAALDATFAKICQLWCAPSWELEYIYDNTSQGSALRRYLVDFTLATGNFHNINENAYLYPKDFLVEVIAAAYKGQIHIVDVGSKKRQEAYTSDAKRVFCEKYHDHSAITKDNKKELL